MKNYVPVLVAFSCGGALITVNTVLQLFSGRFCHMAELVRTAKKYLKQSTRRTLHISKCTERVVFFWLTTYHTSP